MELVTIDLPHHDVLRQPARDVSFPLDDQTKDIIDAMLAFFASLESPLGKPAGLAAPQVGAPLRIIIIQVPPEAKNVRKYVYDTLPLTVLINPSYEPVVEEGENKDWEGCYSVPEKMGEVYRHTVIQYQGYALDGSKVSGVAKGFLARLIQHEVGHLNGELYVDLLRSDSRFGSSVEMRVIRNSEWT